MDVQICLKWSHLSTNLHGIHIPRSHTHSHETSNLTFTQCD